MIISEILELWPVTVRFSLNHRMGWLGEGVAHLGPFHKALEIEGRPEGVFLPKLHKAIRLAAPP